MCAVDLHTHSHCSDGSDPPDEVVRRAAALGFAAVALTDHDTVSGVAIARQAAEEAGIGFLSGTEISADLDGAEIHVVGLGIDPTHSGLLATLETLADGRSRRAERIAEKLVGAGVEIDLDAVRTRLGAGGVIGRMHIAQEIRRLGHARTVQQAFDRFLNPGGKAFVGKARIDCAAAIEAIHAAGGLAFVAHPGIGAARRRLSKLLQLPFDGIEAYHVKHAPGRVASYLQTAAERELLVSGGSDCHGVASRSPEMGKVRVPYTHYERILDALASRRG